MKSPRFDLERQINAAQPTLPTPAAAEAARFEWALADTCRRVAKSMTGRDPRCGVQSSRAGMAIFAGTGSPFTQGMAMGLRGLVLAHELDAIEAHITPSGVGSRQIEVCAFSDPSLHELLAARGYRAKEWQLVWTRRVPEAPLGSPGPLLAVRRVQPGQEELYCRSDIERHRRYRVPQRQCGPARVSPARRAWRADPGAARPRA